MFDRRSLLLGLAAAPALGSCTARPRLRIGYQNGLLLIAKALGRLDAVARVEWRAFASGPPLLEAMGVGGLDLGGTGDTPPVAAAASGSRIMLAAVQPVDGAAAAIIVPARSPLHDVGELKGRRVAWLRGSSAETFVGRALASRGLTVSDVEAVNLAPGDAAAAFAGGSLDAWAVWDPYFAAAEIDHGARVLLGGRPLAASSSFIAANADVAAAQGDVLRDVLQALRATATWAAANRAQLGGLIARETGLPPAVAARVASRQDLAIAPLTPEVIAAEQQVADALFARRQVPARVDVARLAWERVARLKRGPAAGLQTQRSPALIHQSRARAVSIDQELA